MTLCQFGFGTFNAREREGDGRGRSYRNNSIWWQIWNILTHTDRGKVKMFQQMLEPFLILFFPASPPSLSWCDSWILNRFNKFFRTLHALKRHSITEPGIFLFCLALCFLSLIQIVFVLCFFTFDICCFAQRIVFFYYPIQPPSLPLYPAYFGWFFCLLSFLCYSYLQLSDLLLRAPLFLSFSVLSLSFFISFYSSL